MCIVLLHRVYKEFILPIQYVNSVCQFSMSIQYVNSVCLVLIITGENFGIPIPILAKYRIGRVLAQGDFVLVKRCYEKQV